MTWTTSRLWIRSGTRGRVMPKDMLKAFPYYPLCDAKPINDKIG
jgi:hypothetical protein